MAPKTKRANSVDLPEAKTDAPDRQFLHAFPFYIRVDFSCKHFNEEQPHRFVEYLIKSLHSLCEDLILNLNGVSIAVVPTPYTFSLDESESSQQGQQDRGTLLAGVRLPGHDDDDDDDDDEAISRNTYYIEVVTDAISTWLAEVVDSDVYADEQVVPTLYAILTRQQHIDRNLQIDTTYRPAVGSKTLIKLPTQSSDTEDLAVESPFIPVQEQLLANKSVKLRPALEILNGLKHDDRWVEQDYIVIYKERFGGFKSMHVDNWTKDSTEETFIPQHRISAYRNIKTGQTIWHKENRLDLLYGV